MKRSWLIIRLGMFVILIANISACDQIKSLTSETEVSQIQLVCTGKETIYGSSFAPPSKPLVAKISRTYLFNKNGTWDIVDGQKIYNWSLLEDGKNYKYVHKNDDFKEQGESHQRVEISIGDTLLKVDDYISRKPIEGAVGNDAEGYVHSNEISINRLSGEWKFNDWFRRYSINGDVIEEVHRVGGGNCTKASKQF